MAEKPTYEELVKRVQELAQTELERKRVEEALRESEERFRQVVENIREVFWLRELNTGNILYISPSYETIWGRTVEEMYRKGPSFMENVHPEDKERVSVSHRALYEEGRLFDEEYRVMRSDCSPLWVRARCYPVVNKNGKMIRYVGIAEDITDRKRAEKELKNSHRAFRTVLDTIDASIYVGDMNTHEILFMNKHMIDDFGADFTGRICYEVFRGESGPCNHCTNSKLLDAQGNPTGVHIWETKNPITGKWCINYDRAIRWVNGSMVRLQIATDITKLKKLEQERLQTEAQHRQSHKMEAVGRLAGGVAHDFNNMLSVIIGHAELAMMKLQPSDSVYKDLEEIMSAGKRSADLVRQLLAFARKQTISPKVLNLNDTIESMLKMLRRLIGEDIDLIWEPGNALWQVKMDPTQIDQILANLLVNSRYAIKGVGKITIKTGNMECDTAYCENYPGLIPGQYVRVMVSDSGCGIDNEALGKIFEPFFTTKEIGKGTGLGLATVYGIVKQNEGFINAYSEVGKGATFMIYLPRIVAETSTLIDTRIHDEAPRGTETVLLVEDEEALLDLGKKLLKQLGYAVLSATNPNKAIQLVEGHSGPIHLLVTDVIMPEMSGRDLCRRLISLRPGLKCLYISGYTADVISNHGTLEEGVHFLQKPFSQQALAVKIREALDRP